MKPNSLNSPPFTGGSGDGVGLSWEQPVAAAIAMAAIVRIVTLFIIVVNYTRSVLCIFWAEVYIMPQKYAKKKRTLFSDARKIAGNY